MKRARKATGVEAEVSALRGVALLRFVFGAARLLEGAGDCEVALARI